MFYYMDPAYMLLAVVGMGLVFIPQLLVKNTVAKYTKVAVGSGMTGAKAAEKILEEAGVNDVKVVPTSGELTDHYDPSQKVIRLSEKIYYGNSVSSLGIAAHEVGHAIQDNRNFLPMKLRSAFVPAVNAGQTIGPLLLMAGLGLRYFAGSGGGLADLVAITGILFYASVVVFHFVTLPVEFDASFRALRLLSNGGYITSMETSGARKVLGAAALTYVATALYALMELVYWIWRLFGSQRD